MSTFSCSIGDMRQKGTLKKNTPVPDQSGGSSDNYADVLTCRGRLRKLNGKKGLEQGDVVFNKGYEWICRFQSGIVIDVDSAWKINGVFYKISDYEKVDEINHFYRFVIELFQ